ncbi:hypothetical protein PRIC2_001829 [Phytophthora ramorum]
MRLSPPPFLARYQTLLAQRQNLPVHQFLTQIQDAVKQQVIVVEGVTGSGKIPQFLTLLHTFIHANNKYGRSMYFMVLSLLVVDVAQRQQRQ